MEMLTLRTGQALPAIGLGTWKIDKQRVAEVVRNALQIGYRHLDCACDYGNEAEVGEGVHSALQSGICRREDLWITSKLWNTFHAPEHVRAAAERSLRDLGVEHVDLYLIHFPIALRFVPFEKRYPPGWFFEPDDPTPRMEPAAVPLNETWGAMERLVEAGLVRNIGVSNCNVALLRELLITAKIKPAVLQIESHPYLTQEKLLRFCRLEQICVTAFSPLGAISYVPIQMADEDESILAEPVVMQIARRHGKSAVQVLLRWGVQRGTAVIPKSTSQSHLRENLEIFDFELDTAEMDAISGLNRNRRFNDPGDFCETAFNTFFPIYE